VSVPAVHVGTKTAVNGSLAAGLRRVLGPDYRLGYLFVLPMAILVLALVAYPFVYAIEISFTSRIVSRGVPKPASTSGHTGTHSTVGPRTSTIHAWRLCPASWRTGSPSRQAEMPRRGRSPRAPRAICAGSEVAAASSWASPLKSRD